MKVLKETCVALSRSVFTFPSCVFWIASLFPIVGYLFGAAFMLVEGNFKYGYVPTVTTILLSNHKYTIYFSHCCKLLAFIRIAFLIQRYYKRVLHNAAPAARSLISNYLRKEALLSILLILSHLGFLFLDIFHYRKAHSIALFVYFISNYFFNYYLTHLNRIKNGELYPVGCALDAVILFLGVVDVPLLYNEFAVGYYKTYNFTMISLLMVFLHFCVDLKFIFIGMMILSYRFIRFPSDSLS